MTKFIRLCHAMLALLVCWSCFLNVSGAQTADALVPFHLASPTPQTLTLVQGQAGMATLALASGKSFRGEVQLRCTGTTPGIQCLVSPQSITLAPGETSEATVAVATQGSSTYNLKSSASGGWLGGHAASTAGVIGLCCIVCFRRRFARLPLLCAMGFVGMLALSGCAGGKTVNPAVTPTGNTMLKITATSGTIIQSQDLAVTVAQP